MGFATNPPSKPARPQEKVGGKNAHAAKGTSTLEMVLVLPIMLMLSFGIIDYGYYIYLKNLFQGAAQSGVRAAVLPTATNSNVTGSNGVVTQMMTAAGFPSANYSVTLTPSNVSGLTPGTAITVTVTAAWGTVGTHALGASWGGIADTRQIIGTSVMEKE